MNDQRYDLQFPAAATGWICPSCRRVWAPSVPGCYDCNARAGMPAPLMRSGGTWEHFGTGETPRWRVTTGGACNVGSDPP